MELTSLKSDTGVHFGIFLPPATGHLNPMAALGRALISRGHRVTVFQVPDWRARILAHGLEFFELGSAEVPPGELDRWTKTLGTLTGIRGVRYSVEGGRRLADLVCRHGPAAVHDSGVQFLLVDQNDPAGGAVAEHLQIPFASVCTSLPLNREPDIPPPFVNWEYRASWLARLRNRAGYSAADLAISPLQRQVNIYRHRWGLPLLKEPDDSFSKLLQISQTVAEFDFPRRNLPDNFHAVGPFMDERLDDVPFPWEKLDGRPLIYASLGTLQTRRIEIYRDIAIACAGLPVQLVISFGGETPSGGDDWPGAPILVKFAPQAALLRRARMMITHAGLNTVLHCLKFGVPMVVMPITNDQPATASRACWTGAAEAMPLSQLTPHNLCEKVTRVLFDQTYSNAAQRLRDAIEKAGGVQRAAEIVEHAAVNSERTVGEMIHG
jgi:MGT family glycosyltransferase